MKRAPQFVIDITAKRPRMFRVLKDGSKRDVLPGPKRPFVLQERKDNLPRPLDSKEIQQLALNWHEAHPELMLRSFYKQMFHADINAILVDDNTFVTASTKALAALEYDKLRFIKKFMDPKIVRPTNNVSMVDFAIGHANQCLFANAFNEKHLHEEFNDCVYSCIYTYYENAYKIGFTERMDQIQEGWASHCRTQYHK